MRRIAITTALAALGLPGAAQAAPAPAPELGVRLAECQVGALAQQRGAEFSASMPATEGSGELALRFDLEQRRGTGAWKVVPAVPGFGRYERSAPDAAGFVYAKRVERLAVGASYRVVVRFRWSAADGTVLKRATRRSPTCRQPDLRPDVSIVGVTVADAAVAGRATYVVRVRNAGASAVLRTLRVGLVVDGVAVPAPALTGLGTGAVGELTFDGPACGPGGNIVATADPGDGVDEADERDNALSVACPA